MVAYFRRQSGLFMAAGALLGVLFTALAYRRLMAPQQVFARGFLMLVPILIGVIAGRVAASRWASAKLNGITALLYRDGDPEAFLARFEPVAGQVPPNTIEFFDARAKLAFACEALGRFDEGLRQLDGLDARSLRLHAMTGQATLCNQRARLYLLKGDTERANEAVGALEGLKSAASGRAPALATQLANCIDLYTVWLQALLGAEADQAYLQEEIELAKNRIHKSEMQLLLARAKHAAGDGSGAEALLRDAAETGKGLYAGEEASRLLNG